MPEYKLIINTQGSNGSAQGSDTTPEAVYGLLVEVRVVYNGSAPAGTDLTLSEVDGATLLTLTNTNSSQIIVPFIQAVDSAGALIPGVYVPRFIWGKKLTAALAQSNALSPAATVFVKVM